MSEKEILQDLQRRFPGAMLTDAGTASLMDEVWIIRGACARMIGRLFYADDSDAWQAHESIAESTVYSPSMMEKISGRWMPVVE